jgi:hypothetical protein
MRVQHETPVEATWTSVLDVLRGSGHLQSGQLQESGETPVLATRVLTLDQECDAILKRQRPDVRHDRLLFECACHAEQLHLTQAIDGWLQ